jgi:hypothetical protein
VTPSQESLFPLGSSLLDATLEQRLAAVAAMIEAEPLTLAEREQLLLLAIAPAAWGAER